MTVAELQAMLTNQTFDHATYRNHGTLWEGLWIYGKSEGGFRGYAVVGCFPKGSPDLDTAFELTRGTGISVGAYGHG